METLSKVIRHAACAASLVMMMPVAAHAYTARLAWSPIEGATGYRVYVRQNGDAYGAPIEVGMRAPDADGVVRYDLSGLDAAATEWFAVSSYAASNESARSNELGITAGTVPVPTAVATAVATATRTATPVPTATQTAVPTATRTATPVPTATQTVVPTATRTATPVPTATQTAVPTATQTVVPTATETAVPTATRTATATPVPTLTPTPVATGTVVPTAVPTVAPETFRFPLTGWRTGRNRGTWELAFDDEAAREALVTTADQGDKLTVLYPARADLSVALPIATFFARLGTKGGVGLLVRASDGRTYWLRYRTGSGVPSVWRQTAWLPLGAAFADGAWDTTTRDLAADLRTTFGVELVEVEQAELSGTMALADLVLSSRAADVPTAAASMPLPLDAETVRTRGATVEWTYDDDMDCPAVGTPADCETRAVVDVPASPRRLAAPYGRLSFVLADDRDFAVELRVVTSAGTQTLRYDTATAEPMVRERRARLPLTREPIPGSDAAMVTIDMASDVAAMHPGVALENVERVRLMGRFRIGDAILEQPVADD